MVQAGANIPLNLRLEGSRVVYIEPFDLPDDNPKEPLLVVQDEPSPHYGLSALKVQMWLIIFPRMEKFNYQWMVALKEKPHIQRRGGRGLKE